MRQRPTARVRVPQGAVRSTEGSWRQMQGGQYNHVSCFISQHHAPSLGAGPGPLLGSGLNQAQPLPGRGSQSSAAGYTERPLSTSGEVLLQPGKDFPDKARHFDVGIFLGGYVKPCQNGKSLFFKPSKQNKKPSPLNCSPTPALVLFRNARLESCR